MNIFGFELSPELILLGGAVAVVVLFIISLCALIIAIRARKRMKKILKDGSGNDITEAIVNYYQKCVGIMNQYQEAEHRLQNLERTMGTCVKKVGAIRYNAFEGNSSNLSFAAAILDDDNTGFVINGVYSRGQSTTYLKPLNNGKSLYELSEEEEEAIRTAQFNYDKKMQASYENQNNAR